ncbi:MAG: DMT family transporter [Chitinophagaceae bacterium]|nr:DMT family transporter [Chitinophagaceae bacterium]
MKPTAPSSIVTGILLAVAATIIWSGNFIISRAINKEIAPVALSFYRWSTAVLLLLPFAWKHLKPAWQIVKQNKVYFFWTSLTGISLFNTFVYIAGHSSSAINMALIGTTSSPIMSVLLAHYFLKEQIGVRRIIGMLLCISGILFLLSKGSFHNLLHLQFTKGDVWILLAAFSFACYNIFARKRPAQISATGFLFFAFLIGTVILLPAYIIESFYTEPVQWSFKTAGAVLYLGLGTSVIAFLFWNRSIKELGAGRAALFGNLIPVFSSVEAVFILNEHITIIHIIAFLLIVSGLFIDNLQLFFTKK